MAEAQGTLIDRDRELFNVRTALAERDQAFAEARTALAERDRDLATLQSALAERDRTLTDTKTTLAQRDRELADACAALAERPRTSGAEDATVEQVATTPATHDASAPPTAAVDGSTATVASGAAATAAIAAELEVLQAACAQLNADLAIARETLVQEQGRSEAQLAQAASDLKAAFDELATVRARHAELQEVADRLRADLVAAKAVPTAAAGATTDGSGAAAELAEARRRIEALENSSFSLNEQIRDLQLQVATRQREASRATEVLASRTAEYDAALAKRDEHSAKLKGLLAAANKALHERTEQLATLTQQMEQARALATELADDRTRQLALVDQSQSTLRRRLHPPGRVC